MPPPGRRSEPAMVRRGVCDACGAGRDSGCDGVAEEDGCGGATVSSSGSRSSSSGVSSSSASNSSSERSSSLSGGSAGSPSLKSISAFADARSAAGKGDSRGYTRGGVSTLVGSTSCARSGARSASGSASGCPSSKVLLRSTCRSIKNRSKLSSGGGGRSCGWACCWRCCPSLRLTSIAGDGCGGAPPPDLDPDPGVSSSPMPIWNARAISARSCVRGSTGVVGLVALRAGSGSGDGDMGGGEIGAGADVGDDGRKPRRSRRPAHALRTRSREASPAVGVGLSGRFCP